jgi:Ca2+-binding RTX toxin-like protein
MVALDRRSTTRKARILQERLETRLQCSATPLASGFVAVSPDPQSRVIYVSSSAGNDSNNGLSAATPVASLSRGEALIRNQSVDQLLLKSGDVWTTAFPTWTQSGISPLDPILIGSYGTGARPLILTGDVPSAFSTAGTAVVDNLVISGLQFRSDVRNPSSANFSMPATRHQDSGFRWYAPTDGFVLQDCSFQYYTDNLDIEGLNGAITGVSIFGCQSLDSFVDPGGGHRSQGLYGYNLNGITIASSLFDHDGWNETVPNAGRSGYDHDIYLSSTVFNAIIENNIIANASNNGLLARGGGDIENNFFLDNPSAISYGASSGSQSTPGGVHGQILNNVIMGDASLGSQVYGYGLTIANTAPGTPTLVANNIFTGDTQQAKPAIDLTAVTGTANPQDCVGINDLILQNNLFNDWYRPLEIDGQLQPGGTGITALNDLVIQNNDFQNATDYLVRYDAPFSPTAVQWSRNNYSDNTHGHWFELDGSVLNLPEWKLRVDPTATSKTDTYPNGSATQATYDATLGGAGTAAAFLADERSQDQSNWNAALGAAALNDYLRAAFGLPTAPLAVASAASITETSAGAGTAIPTAAAPYTFSVTYSDTQAINLSTIANGNAVVTGPNGFGQSALLVSVTPSADGRSAIGTYSINPPTGSWSGVDDGLYQISIPSGQVRNAAGLAVEAGAVGSFRVALPLVVNGTPRNDRIIASVSKGSLIVQVNRAVSRYVAADVPMLEIFAGDGNDRILVRPGVVPTQIDAGAGNDLVQTFNGSDTLIGGDGNDTLVATGGHNLLLGGAGNDLLSSGAGPNLLDGGDGNDRLHGGSGDDVLIGGTGTDRLQAGRGNQLLIAASSASEDPATLANLLTAWANGQPISERIAAMNLQPATGTGTFSLAGATFTENASVDTVIAGSKPDWLLVESADRLAKKRTDLATILG